MYERIIGNNINNLNKYLTRGFLESKGILVDDNESSIITEIVKSNWNSLYHKDYVNSFNILRNSVKKETYESLLNLYITSMKKF